MYSELHTVFPALVLIKLTENLSLTFKIVMLCKEVSLKHAWLLSPDLSLIKSACLVILRKWSSWGEPLSWCFTYHCSHLDKSVTLAHKFQSPAAEVASQGLAGTPRLLREVQAMFLEC